MEVEAFAIHFPLCASVVSRQENPPPNTTSHHTYRTIETHVCNPRQSTASQIQNVSHGTGVRRIDPIKESRLR